MERRRFGREFKLEAVKLVRERGVTVAQAARDLDLHANLLRKWVRDLDTSKNRVFEACCSDVELMNDRGG